MKTFGCGKQKGRRRASERGSLAVLHFSFIQEVILAPTRALIAYESILEIPLFTEILRESISMLKSHAM